MSLEQTIKNLEALEASFKNGIENLTEEQLEQITSQLQGAFDLGIGEINKVEEASKIQLENLQNEK